MRGGREGGWGWGEGTPKGDRLMDENDKRERNDLKEKREE
jgi:hypothetical protein